MAPDVDMETLQQIQMMEAGITQPDGPQPSVLQQDDHVNIGQFDDSPGLPANNYNINYGNP